MRLFALLLACLIGGCGGCASVPSHEELRGLALRLEFQNGLCSGTPIGPSTVLTATHCLDGGDLRSINGEAAQSVQIRTEGRDTAIIQVAGVEFRRYAKRGPRPTQGQRIRFFGNPGGSADVYREGYVARSWTDGVIIVAPVCAGDSGSGVFSDDGLVVAVISAMTNKHACAFGIAVE